MNTIFTSRYFAYFIILVFVLLKIQHLDYPFYWDESWPYSSAIHAMYYQGPSLSPAAIPAELTRGHPTLFIFLAAVWMKVFGTSLIAIHSFPLFIASTYAIAIYEISRKLFHSTVGIIAVLLTVFQLMFFVQSSFVLLEITLSFFAFLCFYFYATGKLRWLAVGLLLLFFIKETAVVVGLALGLLSILRFVIKDISRKTFLQHLCVFAVPLVGYAVFFSIQKKLLGWYFFPFHLELIDMTQAAIIEKLKEGIRLLFWDDLKKVLLIFGIGLSALAILGRKMYFDVSSIRTYLQPKWNQKQLFVFGILIFLPLILLFNSMNVYINRYFLIIIVPLAGLFAVWMHRFILLYGKSIYYASLALISMIAIYNFSKDKTTSDGDLGAFDVMRVEQEMIAYMETHYDAHTPIATNAYLLRMQLTDSNTRYLQIPQVFTDVNWEITAATQLVIFTNKEFDYQYENVQSSHMFQLIKRFEKNSAWAEIYKRR